MRNSKIFWTVIGFLLAGSGLIALILSLVGVKLSWLAWLYKFGGLFAFIVHLLMVVGGFALIYLMQTDFKGEDTP